MTAPTSSTLLRSLAESAATPVVAATGHALWVTARLPHAASLSAVSLVIVSLVIVSLVTISVAALPPERLRRGYRFSGTSA